MANTITSVASQECVSYEHIVVDGLSKDETMDFVRSSPSVTRYLSELDKGIYDAMNKGIALASGDVIGFLNADDFYADENVLKRVMEVFSDPSVDGCYGDLVYVDEKNPNSVVRYWKSKEYKQGLFKKGWMPAHPTFFVRRSVYEKFGRFNLDYKIAADFEIIFRFIELNKIRVKYLPHVLVKMRLGGTTNKNLPNIIKQNLEILDVIKKHYSDFSILQFVLIKVFNRLTQFITRPSKGSAFK